MTPAELETICQRLYGDRWQSAFARDIARERETINRWARGRSPIPKAVVAWLRRQVSIIAATPEAYELSEEGAIETLQSDGGVRYQMGRYLGEECTEMPVFRECYRALCISGYRIVKAKPHRTKGSSTKETV